MDLMPAGFVGMSNASTVRINSRLTSFGWQHVPESALPQDSDIAFIAGVLRHCLPDLGKDRSEIGISVKHEHRGLGIAPTHVGKQLTDRLQERLLAIPELALTNEHILAVRTDEDIRPPLEIEGLTCGLPLVGSIELHEKMTAECLFAYLAEFVGATAPSPAPCSA